MLKKDLQYESPINITMNNILPIITPKILWYNIKVKPVRTKITNNGKTVFITSKWRRNFPYLKEGPLGCKYIFYNIHFHWGANDSEGSEHQAFGESMPFEMHVLWRNDSYATAKEAKKQDDGILIMAYLFRVSEFENAPLMPVVDCLGSIKFSGTSKDMAILSLSELVPKFEEDFFMYSGFLNDSRSCHRIIWFLARAYQTIGKKQLNEFRSLLNRSQLPIKKNFRTAVAIGDRMLYHVRPARRGKSASFLPSVYSRSSSIMSRGHTSKRITIQAAAIDSQSPFIAGSASQPILLQNGFLGNLDEDNKPEELRSWSSRLQLVRPNKN